MNLDLPVRYKRNRRARRYIIRVTPEGHVSVTVPAFGSNKEAAVFVERQRPWIEKQLLHARRKPWIEGTLIYFRGELVPLRMEIDPDGCWACFQDQRVSISPDLESWQPNIYRALQTLALAELPARTRELAALHQLQVTKVNIRSQRSRWGSCSVRSTISLNWRLVQTPTFVRDYIIVHELMHLREMNHSSRYWAHVASAFPRYLEAERWLRKHGRALRA